MNKRLTLIDFFCGAGGFSEGFRMAGFDVIMGIDNWQPAVITHNINHGLNDSVRNILDFEDINEINKLPNSDVIIGSPPCVLFSLSNHGGNADKDLGVRLIRAFYRVIAVKKHQKGSILKAWLMENVPNSRNYVDSSYTFRDLNLENWAESEGLNPDSVAINVKNNGDILSSNDYGSGQTRKRFVCGEIVKTGRFPQPKKLKNTNITLNNLFHDFPKPMGTEYSLKTLVCDPNYPRITQIISELHDHFYDSGVYEIEWRKALDAKKYHPYMGIMSFPENMNKPSRTIMATKSASTREAILYKSELDRNGDGEYRTPTIREAAIIMGFPITYQFYGNESTKWRQVGNAVSVQLSFALATKVHELLKLKNPKAKEIEKDLSNVAFLDDSEEKHFDKPPKRSATALFRFHPIKSGNITVDLTNRSGKNRDEWNVIAHAGTGKGYTSVIITERHIDAVRKVLLNACPKFIDSIDNDNIISAYSVCELKKHNKEYGYVSVDSRHPYNVIKKISGYIVSAIEDGDKLINVQDEILGELKSHILTSQFMSIYAMGQLIY